MTYARSLRFGAVALLSLAFASGCSSPQPTSTATRPPTAAAGKAAPVIRSTAPIRVGPIRIVAAATVPPLTRSNVIPSPHVIPTARPRAAPKAAPTKPAYVFAPPHAPPRILAINISTLTARGGQTVSGNVETTSNVASVEVRIAGWGMSLPRPRIGYFEASGVIPDLPPFAKGTYTLQVIARNVDGLRTERDFPITLR